MQFIIHYSLHFLLPLLIARQFFQSYWQRAYVIMLLTMLVDLDHLLSMPILMVNRCSICFHPLHSTFAISIYLILLFYKGSLRILGIGLLLHMLTDFIDCIFIYKLYETYSIDESMLTLFHQWESYL
jgi:hypothetical protein